MALLGRHTSGDVATLARGQQAVDLTNHEVTGELTMQAITA